MIYLIAYDLHAPTRDYADVEAAIKSKSDNWAHPQGSVWLVDTQLSPEQWVTILSAAGDANDEYLVTKLSGGWWSKNLDADVVTWLKSPNRRW